MLVTNTIPEHYCKKLEVKPILADENFTLTNEGGVNVHLNCLVINLYFLNTFNM